MIALVIGLALTVAGQQIAPGAPAPLAAAAPATTAAQAWISLIDQQRWDESWAATGSLFQAQMPQAGWRAAIEPVRAPLGTVTSRSFLASQKLASVPGGPDGEYEVIQFNTRFTHKQEAVETVVLAREGAAWKVAGYFIR